MKICFRVDASIEIGTGHVMRCLTLAEFFKRKGHFCVFISRLREGHLNKLITAKGFEILELQTIDRQSEIYSIKHSNWLGVTKNSDIVETKNLITNRNLQFDWIIIDHYGIDRVWEDEIRECIPKIMVVDDLADREHSCEILLDQNYYRNRNQRYLNLVPDKCTLLLGPRYGLLRDEFIHLCDLPKPIRDNKAILVFYGGSDPTNETLKALNSIKEIEKDNLIIHVVVGTTNPNRHLIEKECNKYNYNYHYNIAYMAKLLHEVDVAICAGGSFTWERYCIGVPAITTAIAYNQIELCENVQYLGIDNYIGVSERIKQEDIKNELMSFLKNDNLYDLGETAKSITDGLGKNRVLEVLESTTNNN
ncbi:UDP-2,4-diacetamido-2,4,6-trideoxy-beta-L-altropyranose hydrolase [Virgibacillus sp. JSM 102003]|uniref:UDP-2,4-diacetamido-2,4, 6-trideoxy-beta-L-altropyranose hydrolase n=1 Tax=Virgibacillus sp. JSM 102003 TaxID=1562108 RepID=UPI0035C1E71F